MIEGVELHEHHTRHHEQTMDHSSFREGSEWVLETGGEELQHLKVRLLGCVMFFFLLFWGSGENFFFGNSDLPNSNGPEQLYSRKICSANDIAELPNASF